jgi:hypothetical protein
MGTLEGKVLLGWITKEIVVVGMRDFIACGDYAQRLIVNAGNVGKVRGQQPKACERSKVYLHPDEFFQLGNLALCGRNRSHLKHVVKMLECPNHECQRRLLSAGVIDRDFVSGSNHSHRLA